MMTSCRLMFCVSITCIFVYLLPAVLATCGYDACPKSVPGKLNVHLVAHTHDDVGWLRTVDQYYYYAVQFILDTVIEELLLNPERKFTYVEMAFFYRWWREQNDQRQQQVKMLVNNGRLQFVLGGWCMDDEATTHYVDIVDQHTKGLQFLNDTFGECGRPRVAWQIDPFGHSKEHANLLAEIGYDALYFARIDYQDEINRELSKTMEMLWKANSAGATSSNLFTGQLYGGYCTPADWCFECGDTPVQDDQHLHDYNVKQKVKEFEAMAANRHTVFKTNHILIPAGCDFQYQNAKMNFKIYDKVIKYVNQYSKNVTVYYSTPSCYTKALNDMNTTWPTKSDDFFPYASRAHSFWTGFFTSRAALKRYVRVSSNELQLCKMLSAVSNVNKYMPDADERIDVYRQAMGVVQHHDGVSGTEKQVVAYDYAERISYGSAQCNTVIKNSIQFLTNDKQALSSDACPLANISYCNFTEQYDSFYVQFHNPMSHSVWRVIRLPVVNQYYQVTNEKGQPIVSQTIPVHNGTKRIPERKSSKAKFNLLFNVTNIPALGWIVYQVKKSGSGQPNASVFTPIKISKDPTVLYEMGYYYGFKGNNSKDVFQASGAYIFRPTSTQPNTFFKSNMSFGIVYGPIVNEYHTSWSDWAYQVRIVYSKMDMTDPLQHEVVEWTVGPIPTDDGNGKEVVIQYDTFPDVDTFYTDSNGRQMLQRKINYRPTWKLQQTEPVAGNYYPINSFIMSNTTDGTNWQFQVLTDRAQSAGMARKGVIEVMLHRVTMDDDSLGVGEPLQEKGIDGKGLVIRGEHVILQYQHGDNAAYSRRELAQRQYRQPILMFYSNSPKVNSWSGLTKPLPPNVNILTLENWENGWKLFRLEHLYEVNEHSTLSQPVTINIKHLFTTFNITSLVEMTLAANQEKANEKRLHWNSSNQLKHRRRRAYDPYDVQLQPMEIRTFKIQVTYISV